ncbi:MAG: hypothetical protein ACPL1Y_06190 [Thermoplasmata archaeon]
MVNGVFETEDKLKDKIQEILRNNAEKSINQIFKELSMRQDAHPRHRLVLAGYLQALTDIGILNEKIIPPAKVYSLSPTYRRDLYTTLKKILTQKGYEDKKAAEIYTYTLSKLFRRAVLEDELRFANFTDFSNLKAVDLTPEEKKEIVMRMRRMKYNVEAEKAYIATKNYDSEMFEILSSIILEEYGIKILSMEKKPKQKKLLE